MGAVVGIFFEHGHRLVTGATTCRGEPRAVAGGGFGNQFDVSVEQAFHPDTGAALRRKYGNAISR